mmetsp:Transcript_21252/g.63325  ORF Transcript_21252/g.63325 Transcript_21252/m.63325 type:complete len:213 (-) Transcript_21252:386-1024(-)
MARSSSSSPSRSELVSAAPSSLGTPTATKTTTGSVDTTTIASVVRIMQSMPTSLIRVTVQMSPRATPCLPPTRPRAARRERYSAASRGYTAESSTVDTHSHHRFCAPTLLPHASRTHATSPPSYGNAEASSPVMSATGKPYSTGAPTRHPNTYAGGAACTSASLPKIPPDTQKKPMASSPASRTRRRGLSRLGSAGVCGVGRSAAPFRAVSK